MAFELDVNTSKQYPNSLYIDIVAPEVKAELEIATESPIDDQTPIPEALINEINLAHGVCGLCIIYHANRLQDVGPDREATCPGMRLAGDDETLIELIKSKRAGRATLKVHKTRQPNNFSSILKMRCGVVPALLFPDSSAIQQAE